jgi:type IV pilus assembly protein PilM
LAGNAISNIVSGIKDALSVSGGSVVGIDIGLSSVKVAEVSCDKDKENWVLTKYASVPLPEGSIIEDEIQKEEEIVDAIDRAIKEAGITAKIASIGLAGPNTVARKLQLAGGSEEEIEDQVVWEAEQYLPFEIEQSTVSFHVVGENEGGGVDVIVAAARNDIISSFKNLVEQVNLKVKVVDLGLVAVTNVFELVMEEKIEDISQSWLLIDLGAQKTEFIIYKNGMIAFTKEMNVGGVMITEEIQRQMGVNYDEAEDLKITGDGQGNLPEEILEIIDDVVEAFFSEIKKTIDFYISSTSDESMMGCLVTGGSALIPGIIEGLEALLGVEVSVLNPFDIFGIEIEDLSEEKKKEIQYRGCSVIGLAMRQV